jgi:hypothetical protein
MFFFDHPIAFVGMSIKLRAKTQVRDGTVGGGRGNPRAAYPDVIIRECG